MPRVKLLKDHYLNGRLLRKGTVIVLPKHLNPTSKMQVLKTKPKLSAQVKRGRNN